MRSFFTRTRFIYLVASIAVIALGIVSRLVVTGSVLWDKYLGDALYAVLIYLLLAIWRPRDPVWLRAVVSFALAFAVELFQLTGIPVSLIASENLAVKLFGIALGAHFRWWDVLAYALGIAFVVGVSLGLRAFATGGRKRARS